MKTKILADFQICISVPVINLIKSVQEARALAHKLHDSGF